MSIEEAKFQGWNVYKADQSQFEIKHREVIWSIKNPTGRIWNIAGGEDDTEESIWEHALRHFINRK